MRPQYIWIALPTLWTVLRFLRRLGLHIRGSTKTGTALSSAPWRGKLRGRLRPVARCHPRRYVEQHAPAVFRRRDDIATEPRVRAAIVGVTN
jgi:hypothetical protein